MAKKKRQESGEEHLEHLRGLGIPVDELAAPLVPTLVEHWGKDRDTDLAVAYALGRIPERSAAEALLARAAEAADREVKREIRRALYKLAQRGVVTADLAAEKTAPREAVINLGPDTEGYMSPVDGSGTRMVWLAKPQMGGGVAVLEGLVNDREGLRQTGGGRIRRKDLREMMETLEKKPETRMAPIPWEYADRMLYEAYEKARGTGREGLEEFTSVRSLFTAGKPKGGPHPIYGLLERESAREGAWRSLSRRLFEEPELRSWVVERERIEPYLKRFQDAQESRLVLNQAQKEERVAAIVRSAAEEIFAGDGGRLYQRRLEDMALYFFSTGRAEQARLALAVALALEEGDVGGLGALDVTFLTRLAERSFVFYLSEKKEGGEEDSLIVKP
ncbi:MAG TPA: hypothetical protein VNL14_15090 [Candidatus Acidoferrales bacterium]|nr:hypothetical protein [Candidatus Acidoferrales bacterium]